MIETQEAHKIINGLDVSNLTKKTYTYKYNYLINSGIIIDSDENVIINKLKELHGVYKINKIYDIITILVIIRKNKQLDVTKIENLKKTFIQQNKYKVTETTAELNESNYSKEEIIKYINLLYENKEYKKYIINVLLMNLKCRNKDLNLIITKNYEIKNSIQNYLVLKENGEVEIIRNDYKTSDKYGQKMHSLKSHKLYNACEQLLGDKNEMNLLTNVNKNEEIIKSTYKSLGEGRYFKIFIKDTRIENMKVISELRGTSPSSITQYYTN